ncbi:MAG: Mu-like prophage major head subunit gpT family protein [Capsulimonadales bacterium]|nr:Mu-like prophage major head subunit gpT family protein [Capsulimonadales bacterium]
MAAVTSDVMRSLTAMCKAIYGDGYNARAGVWQDLATVIPSTQGTETYAWLGEIPVMRPWLDERQLLGLREYGFTITNLKWEATLAISRVAIEDDQTGQIKIRVLALADAANQHYDKMLFDLINGNPTAYDGVAMYAAAHANLETGAGSALSATKLQAVIAAMKSRLLPNGEPMDITPTHLLVPPALEWTAKQILNSAYWPDAAGAGANATNVLQGALKLVVSARLATATEWHVFDCSRPVKPWIIQQRIAPEFQALEDVTANESVFLRDEFLFGVRSRDNAGPGMWQYAYRCTGA